MKNDNKSAVKPWMYFTDKTKVIDYLREEYGDDEDKFVAEFNAYLKGRYNGYMKEYFEKHERACQTISDKILEGRKQFADGYSEYFIVGTTDVENGKKDIYANSVITGSKDEAIEVCKSEHPEEIHNLKCYDSMEDANKYKDELEKSISDHNRKIDKKLSEVKRMDRELFAKIKSHCTGDARKMRAFNELVKCFKKDDKSYIEGLPVDKDLKENGWFAAYLEHIDDSVPSIVSSGPFKTEQEAKDSLAKHHEQSSARTKVTGIFTVKGYKEMQDKIKERKAKLKK